MNRLDSLFVICFEPTEQCPSTDKSNEYLLNQNDMFVKLEIKKKKNRYQIKIEDCIRERLFIEEYRMNRIRDSEENRKNTNQSNEIRSIKLSSIIRYLLKDRKCFAFLQSNKKNVNLKSTYTSGDN